MCIPKMGTSTHEPLLELAERRVLRHLSHVVRLMCPWCIKARLTFYLFLSKKTTHLSNGMHHTGRLHPQPGC